MNVKNKVKKHLVRKPLKKRQELTEFKQLEKELKKSQVFLDSMIEQSPYAIWISDDKGNLLRINRACCDLLKISEEEIVGKYNVFRDNIVEEQGFLPLVQSVYKKGETVRFELKYDTSQVNNLSLEKRALVILDVTIFPIIGTNGNVTNAVIQHIDITERKQAEKALTESESKFAKAFNSSPTAIIISWLADGIIIDVNESWKQITGFSREEVLGKSSLALDLLLSEDRQHAVSLLNKQGFVRNFELEIRRKSGEVRQASLSAEKIEINGEQCMITTLQDITERKQWENTLRNERDMLDLVTKSVGIGLAIISKDYKTTWANKILKDIFGEVDGKVCYSTFNQRHDICPGCGVRKVFETGTELVMHEQAGKDAEGNVIWSQIVATPIKDKDGNIKAALEAVVPITERKLSEQKLELSYEKLQKTLKDAVAAIAKISEMKDPYTAGHQTRVAKLATAIAREMNLKDEQLTSIQIAAAIHDIGKIYVPSEILSKPGKLNEVEFSLIRTHPQGTYDILKDIDFIGPVARITLEHHERLDGSGYPNGLKGEEMLPESKILAVADVVEAMSSHRPYRPGLGIGKALEEIIKNRDILYDAEVVEICVKLFYEKGFKF